MNIVKIYKEQEEYPRFIIESTEVINSEKFTSIWNCKEEIYLDDKLKETIYHTI